MTQWQDIATAPKDGTPVDLWMVNDEGHEWRVTDAQYVESRDDELHEYDTSGRRTVQAFKCSGWQAPNQDHGEWGWCDQPERFNTKLGRMMFTKPTHWMPVPLPPTEGKPE